MKMTALFIYVHLPIIVMQKVYICDY